MKVVLRLKGTMLGGGRSAAVLSASHSGGQIFSAGSTTGSLTTVDFSQSIFGGGSADGFVVSFSEAGGLQ